MQARQKAATGAKTRLASRSWQQDGLLVKDADGRRLRGGGGGGGDLAVERLRVAMRKAEAAVLELEGMEVNLLVKDFFNGPVEAVLQRMAGPGGRRPAGAGGGEAGARGGRWTGTAAAADAAGGGEGGGGGVGGD